jgi:hypothetical protein
VFRHPPFLGVKMAKRFIDTDIWKKSWFRQLPPKMKSVWVYLTTNCDHAGIYEVDLELMSFMVGQKVTSKEIDEHLGNQISVINSGSKWYLSKFVGFQYGELNPNVKAHQSVLKQLNKYSIDETLAKGLGNTLESVQDKDKDKVKVKDKEDKKSLNSIDKIFLEELQDQHLDVDVKAEFLKFKDYLSANGKTYKDYRAGFRNWIRNDYTPKTDKIKNERFVKRQQEKSKPIYSEDEIASPEERAEALKSFKNLGRKFQA